jgi:hypothetical protein
MRSRIKTSQKVGGVLSFGYAQGKLNRSAELSFSINM